MTRKDLNVINSDKVVVNLRMQSEDLINNIDSMSESDFITEAKRIEALIDARISVLLSEL